MADKQTRMPSSTAGITRFFEDYRTKIEFSPGHVIIFAIIVTVIVLMLHLWGGALLA